MLVSWVMSQDVFPLSRGLPFKITMDGIPPIAHAGLNGVAMPVIPEMNAVWSAWNNALTLIHQGTETAEGAFTTAAEQIRTALE